MSKDIDFGKCGCEDCKNSNGEYLFSSLDDKSSKIGEFSKTMLKSIKFEFNIGKNNDKWDETFIIGMCKIMILELFDFDFEFETVKIIPKNNTNILEITLKLL